MRFYDLDRHPSGIAETCFSKKAGYNQGHADQCAVCGAFTSSLTWLPPYQVEIELYGKQFGDLAFGYGGNDFLVSQRFREVYYQHELTGLVGFDPIEVIKVKNKSRRKLRCTPPLYFRVVAMRGATALDHIASEFQWDRSPTCPACKSGIVRSWKRLLLEPGTWTGEDVFRPKGLGGTIMVTERFKVACEQHGITNAVFTPAEDAGHDFYAPHP
jgi:hypothetical protein